MEKQNFSEFLKLETFGAQRVYNFFSNLSYSPPNFVYDCLIATTLLPEWAKMALDVVLFFFIILFLIQF